jgi:hypothetical protein
MAASHRSRGEHAPGVGSLRGLAYNGVGVTWILTSDFAENGADTKMALRQRRFFFMVHHGWEASPMADSRRGVLKRRHCVHAVLYKVLTGLGK